MKKRQSVSVKESESDSRKKRRISSNAKLNQLLDIDWDRIPLFRWTSNHQNTPFFKKLPPVYPILDSAPQCLQSAWISSVGKTRFHNLIMNYSPTDTKGNGASDVFLSMKKDNRTKKEITATTTATTTTTTTTIPPSSSIYPHLESFQLMEQNLYRLKEFVYCPQKRIEMHQKQIERCQELKKTVIQGKASHIRIRQHAEIIEARERECIRVIQEGIEKEAFDERMKTFVDMWHQLPVDKRRNADQFLNFYCQFFQTDQTIPEVSTQKICSNCHCKLHNSKRESDWDCVECGLFVKYLNSRSNVRISYNTNNNHAVTSESKSWSKFCNNLDYFVDLEETPITDELKQQILAAIDHGKPLSETDVRPAMINKTLKSIGKKDLGPWTNRIYLEFTTPPHIFKLLSLEEFNEIKRRMKYIQYVYTLQRRKDNLELCDPKYAFRRICLLTKWSHLLYMFPCKENEDDYEKWKTLIKCVIQYDPVTNWKDDSEMSDLLSV